MTALAPALPLRERARTRPVGPGLAVGVGLGLAVGITVGVVILALVVGIAVLVAHPEFRGRLVVPLRQSGLALGADGQVQAIGDQDRLVPGTRVLAGTPETAAEVDAESRWLAAGRVPQPTELGDSTLTTDALLDLRLLTGSHRAAVAGWSPAWAYVWPRDSAFVALAFARTGHQSEAERILDYLQAVQASDGTFQARYVPDEDQPPDGRGVQLDGTGWAVWALAQVAATLPPVEARALIERHRTLLRRSVAQLEARTAGRLPVSPDYWEVPEHRPTLATSAVLLDGLTSAAGAYRRLGLNGPARQLTQRATEFRARLLQSFGPDFPRRLGGSADSADLGVAFLLPPFAPNAEPEVVAAWRRSLSVMGRASGGFAPGGSWRQDGVSWTPTTATEAMTAAALGDRSAALDWLKWIGAHRTSQGAIPEKVLWDGRPASVAPIGWSSAAVVIAADELTRG